MKTLEIVRCRNEQALGVNQDWAMIVFPYNLFIYSHIYSWKPVIYSYWKASKYDQRLKQEAPEI